MKKEILKMESGRSMVEMLGVLAIIGVLSVMGIAGYRTAMMRHRANELLNEATKRATVVAGQISLNGQNPSLNEFNEKDFSGGSFETTIYGASGTAAWTNAETDKQFTLSITGVNGVVCELMKGTESAYIKGFSPDSCDPDNTNTVKLTYNNDLSPENVSSGDNNTGNAPTTPSTCAENNMYWCPTSQTCVANQTECLALCPQDRLCGDTCCGEGNVCVDGNKCCLNNGDPFSDAICCNTSESNGFGTVEWKCCAEGKEPFFSFEDAGEVECCDGVIVPAYEKGDDRSYKQCCPEGSTVYNRDNWNCCATGEILVEDIEGYHHCCPVNSAGWSSYDEECCESGTALVKDENGYTHCCPAGSVGVSNSGECCAYGVNIDGGCCSEMDEIFSIANERVCCNEGTPYCTGIRKEDNSCTDGWDYCSGTPYFSWSDNYRSYYSCCESEANLIDIDGRSICCYDNATGFCMERNNEGNCTVRSCCAADKKISCLEEAPNGVCNLSVCCSNNWTPHCLVKDANGRCKQGTCCPGSSVPYCSRFNNKGECVDYGCCDPNYVSYGTGENGTDVCSG